MEKIEENMKIVRKYLKKIENNGILFFRIRRSLLSSIKMREILSKEKEDIYYAELLLSFYDTMIVSYGSCFSKCGKGVKKLEKNIFKNNDYLKKIHIELMNARNELVAHNGGTKLCEISLGQKEKGNISILKYNCKIITPSIKGVDRYIEVIRFVYESLSKDIDEMIKKINGILEKDGVKYEICKEI